MRSGNTCGLVGDQRDVTSQQWRTPTAEPRPIQLLPPPEPPGVPTLRFLAYLTTTIASLLFIALVIIGYVKWQQATTAMQNAVDQWNAHPTLVQPPPLPPIPAWKH